MPNEETLGSLGIDFDVDNRTLKMKMSDSGRSIRDFVNQSGRDLDRATSKFRAFSHSISGIGGILATIGIAKFSSDIIGAATRLDTMEKGLTRTEGSLEAAKKRLIEFRNIAKDPGLEMSGLTRGYVQLKSIGQESEKSIKFLRGVGNEIAKIGGSEEDLGRVVRQFVQMQGKGKVMAEDLVVIAESMPNIRKLMQDAFGTTSTEALQKAGVTAQQFFDKITESLGKQEKAIGGAKNAQTNFKSAIEQLNAALGEGILPTLTDFLEKTTGLIDKFNEMPEATKKVIGKSVAGGVGILGIVFALSQALNLANNLKTALGGLGAVNVAQNVATASSGLAASGLLDARGNPIMRQATTAGVTAGAVSGGLPAIAKLAITAASVAIAAGTVIWSGKEIYNALTRGFTAEEKAKIRNPKQSDVEARFEGLPRFEANRLYSGQMEAEEIVNKALRNAKIDIGVMNIEMPLDPEIIKKNLADAGLDKLASFDPTGERGKGKGSYAMYQAEGGRSVALPDRVATLPGGIPYAKETFNFSNYFNKAVLGDIEGFTNSFDALTDSFIKSSNVWEEGKKKLAEYLETEKSIAIRANESAKAEYQLSLRLKDKKDALEANAVPMETFRGLISDVVKAQQNGIITEDQYQSLLDELNAKLEDGIVTNEEYAESVERINKAKSGGIAKMDAEISKLSKEIAGNWKDIGGWINKADKEQIPFWTHMDSGINNAVWGFNNLSNSIQTIFSLFQSNVMGDYGGITEYIGDYQQEYDDFIANQKEFIQAELDSGKTIEEANKAFADEKTKIAEKQKEAELQIIKDFKKSQLSDFDRQKLDINENYETLTQIYKKYGIDTTGLERDRQKQLRNLEIQGYADSLGRIADYVNDAKTLWDGLVSTWELGIDIYDRFIKKQGETPNIPTTTGGGGTGGGINLGTATIMIAGATIAIDAYENAQQYQEQTGQQGYVGIGHPLIQTSLTSEQVDQLYEDMPFWQKQMDAMSGGKLFKDKIARIEKEMINKSLEQIATPTSESTRKYTSGGTRTRDGSASTTTDASLAPPQTININVVPASPAAYDDAIDIIAQGFKKKGYMTHVRRS